MNQSRIQSRTFKTELNRSTSAVGQQDASRNDVTIDPKRKRMGQTHFDEENSGKDCVEWIVLKTWIKKARYTT